MRSILQELVANHKHSDKITPVHQAKVTEEGFDPKPGTKQGRDRGNGRRKPPLYALNRAEGMTWTGKFPSWEELRAPVASGKRGFNAKHFSTNSMASIEDSLEYESHELAEGCSEHRSNLAISSHYRQLLCEMQGWKSF